MQWLVHVVVREEAISLPDHKAFPCPRLRCQVDGGFNPATIVRNYKSCKVFHKPAFLKHCWVIRPSGER